MKRSFVEIDAGTDKVLGKLCRKAHVSREKMMDRVFAAILRPEVTKQRLVKNGSGRKILCRKVTKQ